MLVRIVSLLVVVLNEDLMMAGSGSSAETVVLCIHSPECMSAGWLGGSHQ